MAGTTPAEILALALTQAEEHINSPTIVDSDIVARIELITRNTQNRAGARFILACALAKAHDPDVDIRKPYTEIGDPDCYSGRTYDESFITDFVMSNDLPCNATTAFLTPALRNRNAVLTPGTDLVGRPASVYLAALQLLDDVYMGKISATELLTETVRWLLVVRNEQRQRMESLLTALKATRGETILSAEEIIALVGQHLKLKKTSRLPVLIVAAAYRAAQDHLGERALPLQRHTAADKQTGALGDVEITLVNDDAVITSYEMKTRRVTKTDIEHAITKIIESKHRIDNYIFITTEKIEENTAEYAASIYHQIGVEIVVLDCIGLLRHFLHLFYRLRVQFLEFYQELLLSEPQSAVSQPIKEAFLAMRQAAESLE